MKNNLKKLTVDSKTLIGLASRINAIEFEDHYEVDYNYDGLNIDYFNLDIEHNSILLSLNIKCSYYIHSGEMIHEPKYSLYEIQNAYNEEGQEEIMDAIQAEFIGKIVEQKS